MRALFLPLSASLLVLSCGASAGPMPYPQTDEASTSTVQVTAPAAVVHLTNEQVEQVAGAYKMSNGWRLKVNTVSSRYIDARIDHQKRMRLRAVSPDEFVSRDGTVSMRFNQGESGDDMTMRYVPDARLAQVVTISARMAQR